MNNTAIILAAGQSSRMYPLADKAHKSMIKIMGKPILFYTIEALRKSNIHNLIIVVDEKRSIRQYFGSGQKFGVHIKYIVQSKPEGMGDALLLCKDHIKSDFFLLNASHLDVDIFVKDILKTKQKNIKGVMMGTRKKSGRMQGVFKFSGKRVEKIVEKPKAREEPSDMHVIGIYFFDKDFLYTLEKTPREHYRLEKAISSYAKVNHVEIVEAKKDTVSLKYPWDLLEVKDYLFKHVERYISSKANIAKSAEIIGEVIVDDGVKIMEGVRIKGPAFIGKNVTIGNNALLRNGVDIEENCVVGGYMEIKNSIFMRNSTTHSGFIGDSVVGEDCKIAAQFCTGNLRLDRNIIKSVVRNEETETGLKYLGVIVGEGVNIGIRVSTMPGVIIGKNSIVGPSTVVMKNVPNDTKYYTKFREIISKKNE